MWCRSRPTARREGVDMSDFRDLMHAQMDDAAAGFAGEDFAGGYGRGVVGRVRRRRTVRAVGVGGVSAVAVGALAVGSTQLLGGTGQPAGGASVRCVPVENDLGSAMWQGDVPLVLLSSFGDGVSVSLTADALTVSLPGKTDAEQVVEVRDQQLVGPDGVTDGPVVVTFASGEQAVVDLDWTNDRVQVAFGRGTEPTSTASGGLPAGAGDLLLPGEAEGQYHGLDLSGGNDVRWLLYDDVRQQVQAMIEITGDQATVTFRDGATQSFPTGDDGIATFTWAGVTTVSLDPEAISDALLWGPDVKAPVDQTITGSLLCNVLATGPDASAQPSPSPSESATAAEDVTDPAYASPFQCGFEFSTPESGTEELGIGVRTASVGEIRAEFDRRFGNQPPTVDVGTDAGVWATVTGMPGGTGEILGALSVLDPRTTDGNVSVSVNFPDTEPGNYQIIPEGISFVGVRGGVVVARVEPGYDGATPGVVLDSDGLRVDPAAFLLDVHALTACDAVTVSPDSFAVYVVAGYDTAPLTAGNTTYAWKEVPAP